MYYDRKENGVSKPTGFVNMDTLKDAMRTHAEITDDELWLVCSPYVRDDGKIESAGA